MITAKSFHYRLHDIVSLKNDDPNIIGLVTQDKGNNTYEVEFQMHSNSQHHYFTRSMTVSGSDLKPVKIDFSHLKRAVHEAELKSAGKGNGGIADTEFKSGKRKYTRRKKNINSKSDFKVSKKKIKIRKNTAKGNDKATVSDLKADKKSTA